jgi:4-hydroxybenzoate polyprenyltransferase
VVLVVALSGGLTPVDCAAELALARLTGRGLCAEDLPLDAVVLARCQSVDHEAVYLLCLPGEADLAAELAAGLGLFAAVVQPDELQALRAGAAEACQMIGGPTRGRLRAQARALWRGMRPHHWTKSLLVFLPLLAAHRWADVPALTGSLLAFVAMCLSSSGIYLINDLFDLGDDRRHLEKRRRPLAAGQLGIRVAAQAAAGLIAAGLMFAGLGGAALFAVCAAYVVLALTYSLLLKRLRFVDLACLALLYALRVMAGAAAAGIAASGWLIWLSLLLFTSLAAVKRATELSHSAQAGLAGIARRGYRLRDLAAVVWLGRLAGLAAAVVVLAYAGAAQTRALYARPDLLWLNALLLFLWVGRIWQVLPRGHSGSDPILFALRDPLCRALALALVAGFVAAVIG